jgi:hypothetical protein
MHLIPENESAPIGGRDDIHCAIVVQIDGG